MQALYGVIQGGVFEDLRDESIAFNLKDNKFFGLAIGGSLGSRIFSHIIPEALDRFTLKIKNKLVIYHQARKEDLS